MKVPPIQSGSSLRLVQAVPPIQAKPQVVGQSPNQPISKPPKAEDSYSFEAIYRANLPKTMLTDAHRKLERIRDLVAGRTDVPVHFESAQPAASANPYTPAYMQFPRPSAAQVNEAATEQQVGS